MYSNRVKYIDGLRALAILMVVFHHWGLVIEFCVGKGIESILTFLTKYGWVGVEIFFFLSGLMISEKYTKSELYTINVFEFIWKRVKGIYPLLFINLFISICLNPQVNMLQVFRTFLFLHCGFFRNPQNGLFMWDIGGATWFLGPLVICYFVFYLINKYCNKDDEIKSIIYILLVLTGMICIESNLQYIVFNIYIGRGFSGFFMGVIYNKLIKELLKNLKKIIVVILSMGLLVGVVVVFINGNIGNLNIISTLVVLPSVISLCENISVIRKILGNSIFQYIGENSSVVYLLHMPVLRVIERVFKNTNDNVFTEVHLLYYILAMIGTMIIVEVFKKKKIFSQIGLKLMA